MLGKLIRAIVPASVRPIGYLQEHTARRADTTVQLGPFKGMKYLGESFFSAYIPKVLGIYERELYPAIESAIARGFRTIIDVGAAEGYFAVGMARRCPSSRVVAFEMDPRAQAMLRTLAGLNGATDRIDLRGICDRAALGETLGDGRDTLLICDCEGYELMLLDPMRTPALANTHVLVELHDFTVFGIAEELTERFAPTHEVERIWQTDRNPDADYPYPSAYTRALPRSYMEWAVSEWRPVRMSWLWMRPRSNP